MPTLLTTFYRYKTLRRCGLGRSNGLASRRGICRSVSGRIRIGANGSPVPTVQADREQKDAFRLPGIVTRITWKEGAPRLHKSSHF